MQTDIYIYVLAKSNLVVLNCDQLKNTLPSHTHYLLTHTTTLSHSQLLKGVTISQGGVLPHIPEVLLFRKGQTSKSKPHPPATPTEPPAASKPGTVQSTTFTVQPLCRLSWDTRGGNNINAI